MDTTNNPNPNPNPKPKQHRSISKPLNMIKVIKKLPRCADYFWPLK